MIREFTIENFKSIESLKLPLGRVTVLIGENGAGKSNIIEAMAFFGAAVQDKLDPEFLYARGVRGCSDEQVLSAFKKEKGWRTHSFHLVANGTQKKAVCDLLLHDMSRSATNNEHGWALNEGPPSDYVGLVPMSVSLTRSTEKKLAKLPYKNQEPPKGISERHMAGFVISLAESIQRGRSATMRGKRLMPTPFVIYSPENTALRAFETEGQMRPLGVRGEGLFRLVQRFAEESPERFKILRNELKLFDWFSDFSLPKRLGVGESRIDIKDRFLAARRLIDQRSANEGFLFVLFYLCLFLSPHTPQFFAIDNIDASLNPKLCAELMRRLVVLAKEQDKQVIITTHNPAILDGLDLRDDEQLLYAVQRNEKGRTIAQRIPAPKPQPGEPALKLSHAYLRGLLGGVPKNF